MIGECDQEAGPAAAGEIVVSGLQAMADYKERKKETK
jgi:hypothetical protein